MWMMLRCWQGRAKCRGNLEEDEVKKGYLQFHWEWNASVLWNNKDTFGWLISVRLMTYCRWWPGLYTGSEQPDVNVPVMVFRRVWWICARFDNDIYFGFQNDLLQFALMGLQGKKKTKNRNIKSFLVWFNISVLNNRDILSAELHKVVSVKTFAGNMCVCSVKSHCMLLLNDTVSAENPLTVLADTYLCGSTCITSVCVTLTFVRVDI